MSEALFNENMTELFHHVEHVLPSMNTQVERTVDALRLSIADILAKYQTEGTIPTNQLKNVVDEVLQLEGELYRNLRRTMAEVIKDIAERSTESIADSLVTAFGVPTLSSMVVGGIVAEQLTSQVLLSALIGMDILAFITAIVTSTFNRKESDNKTLADRLKQYVSDLLREVSDTLRKSILKGEDNGETLQKIKRTIRNSEWRTKTLVNTESLYTVRQSIARFADRSGIVAGMKIVDFPHGNPAEHMRHKCYIYANSDEHGLGKGVYPVGTLKIRNPHPQCRSILHLVFVDELKGGRS